MFKRADRKVMALSLAIAIAVVAVAIPTCQMIGCDMDMSLGMMRISTLPGPQISGACTGTWVASTTQYGVVSSEFITALLSLVVAIAAAVVLFAPRVAMRPVRIVDSTGPPPPLDERGERFLV